MITAGQPSHSLLYHALASPNVFEQPDGTELTAFPSLQQIDVIENAVFGTQPPTLEQLRAKADTLLGQTTPAELAVAVYATEYRPAPKTVHRRYAGQGFAGLSYTS